MYKKNKEKKRKKEIYHFIYTETAIQLYLPHNLLFSHGTQYPPAKKEKVEYCIGLQC